ncbi:MAG: short-chain Z-isoprenyl diphosphate synthase [Nocardioidaceae bacterium]|nr:short-chain Z-isoprenyl diphosphate synthase [Nocardioidaceae bacterium]
MVSVRRFAYDLYERRLLHNLPADRLPEHIGVMCDGNRRWARAFGAEVAGGYLAGADKIEEFLGWCDQLNINLVTLWLLSTDNLGRPAEEVGPLLDVIEDLVDELASKGRWRVHPVGALDMLPATTMMRLKAAAERTAEIEGMTVNIAVAYGGRRELADAVRSMLIEHAQRGTTIEELAEVIDMEHIAEHLYTKGQPDPDLVIRTSGEQRMSGFLLWQSAHSEFYFCEALWPDFRRTDFLRAIRDYAARNRRFGA